VGHACMQLPHKRHRQRILERLHGSLHLPPHLRGSVTAQLMSTSRATRSGVYAKLDITSRAQLGQLDRLHLDNDDPR
jgi:hypothetical protein